MGKIFLLLVTALSANTYSQQTTALIGKWKVVVMDNGERWDHKTDSLTVSQQLLDTIAKYKDAGFSLDEYISWAKSCGNCFYSFNADGTQQQFRDEQVAHFGTYTVSAPDSTIKVVFHRGDQRVPHDFKYYFKGPLLVLKMQSFIKREITVELERVK